MATRTLIVMLVAVLVGIQPAEAQHGTYYQAHYHAGRWFPAGHYTVSNGTYFHNGVACHGYACPSDYHATVVEKKVVVQEYPAFLYSVNPYQQPQAQPAAAQPDSKDRLLEALVLGQQQQQAFMLQLLAQRSGGGPVPQMQPFQPIPPAKAAAPKAGLDGFMAAYCTACHGANGAKGGLNLSDLSAVTRKQWNTCFDRMWCDESSPMPPRDKPQPTAAEKKFALAEMQKLADAAR